MYQTIFFDLDGTLTDSGKGITRSVAYALKKYGIEDPDFQVLHKFVGPPLSASFQKYFQFSEEQALEAVAYYREYYTETGIFENAVYPGVPELLKRLKEAGFRLVVATAKPEKFARIVLEHFHLADYFDEIVGASMDESRNKKSQVIAYALERCGLQKLEEAIMVGDREDDVKGAKDNKMACIGVLYGYGSRAELELAGADYLAETVEDIWTLLQEK